VDRAQAIVVVGVESTGKSTLARALAEHTGRTLVPEIARSWLDARGNRYEEGDLEPIARLQWRAEADAARTKEGVVADTDLVVIRIWSEVRFGRCAPWILEALATRPPAVYLLTRPDLPWEPDPQRASPDAAERAALHARYRRLLRELGHPWHEIGGEGDARLAAALAALDGEHGA
jgi:nicotinamide riboside kinase